MNPTHHVTALTPHHAARYFDIRREMLVDSPVSFGSSPEDDRYQCEADVATSLAKPGLAILGVLDATALVAVAGIRREEQAKARHVAGIWGVYVRPAHRGRGLGRAVTAAAIEAARAWEGVRWVQLAASLQAPAAIATYRSLGFVPWGVEPAATQWNGREYDEVHMRLRL